MGFYDDEEQRAIDDLKLRVERNVDKKSDRGIEKGIITPEEGKKLEKAISKAVKHTDNEWWELSKGMKSYEIAMELLKAADIGTYYEEIEILEKIQKA